MDLMLSMNSVSNRGKIVFRLVKNSRSSEYPEGNSRLAWKRLNSKFASKTSATLLMWKKKFENSRLQDPEDDPDDWISELEGYLMEIDTIDASSAISEKDLMVHVLNNLPKEYDMILDGLENRLDKTGDEGLTIEVIREKLSGRFERIKKMIKEDDKREYIARMRRHYWPWEHSPTSLRGLATVAESMVTRVQTVQKRPTSLLRDNAGFVEIKGT